MRLLLEQQTVLTGYIRAMVGSRQLAEDVFQDLAMLVMRKASEIPNPEAFSGWIRRAARWEARNAMRKNGRERVMVDEDILDLIDREAQAVPSGPGEDPRLAALDGCVQKLSPSARALLKMRYTDELSGDEMAGRTGRPAPSIYVTMCRIHRTLELCVKERLAGQHHA